MQCVQLHLVLVELVVGALCHGKTWTEENSDLAETNCCQSSQSRGHNGAKVLKMQEQWGQCAQPED